MVSICFSPSCTPVCVCMVASDIMITARVLYVYVCVPKLHYISSYMKITFNKILHHFIFFIYTIVPSILLMNKALVI